MGLYEATQRIKQIVADEKKRQQESLTAAAQAGTSAMASFAGVPSPQVTTPGYEIITRPERKPEWDTLKEIGGTIGRVPGQALSQMAGMVSFVTGSETAADLSNFAGEQARRDFPSAAPQITSADDLSRMSLTDLAKYGLSESGQVISSGLAMLVPGMAGASILSKVGAAAKLAPAISKVAQYSPKVAKMIQGLGGVEAAAAHATRGLAGWGAGTLLEGGSMTTDAYDQTGEMPERLKILPFAMVAGAMEYLPFDNIVSSFAKVAGADVAQQASKMGAKRAIGFITDYLKASGFEGLTEYMQTLTEEAGVKYSTGTPATQAIKEVISDPNAHARAFGAGVTGMFGGAGAKGTSDLAGAVARAKTQAPAEPVVIKSEPVQEKPVEQPLPLPTEPTQPVSPEELAATAPTAQATAPQPQAPVQTADVGGSESVSDVKLKRMVKNVSDAMQAIGITDDMVVEMTGKPLADMTMPELQQVNEFVMNQAAMGNVVGQEPAPAQTQPPVSPPANLNQAIQMAQRPEIRQPAMPMASVADQTSTMPQAGAMPTVPAPQMQQPVAPQPMQMQQPVRQPMAQTPEVTRQITPEDMAPFADQPEIKPETTQPEPQLPAQGEIYETTLRTKEGPVKYFAIRGDSKDGFGDQLFRTREEAEYWKNKKAEIDAANEEYRKKEAEKEAARQKVIDQRKAEAAEKRAKSAVIIDDDYVSGLRNLDRGRLNKILDTEVSYGGKTMTKREVYESGAYVKKETFNVRGKEIYALVAANETIMRVPKIVYDAIKLNESVAQAQPTAEPTLTAEPAVTKSAYGESNTITSKEAYEAAKARLKAGLKKVTSGVDPTLMPDAIIVGMYHIEAGIRKFADFAKAMIDDIGDGVKPYLASAYSAAKSRPEFDSIYDELESQDEVRRQAKELMAETISKETTETVTQEKPNVTLEPETNITQPADMAEKLLPYAESLLTEKSDNRKLDKAMTDAGLDPADRKRAQEALEGAITLLIRKNNLYGDFYQLKKLYENMPNLNERTGGSMTRQAYSTPHILASLLADTLNLPKDRLTIYEPTAGNGLLLSGVVENQAGTRNAYFLNELDNNRNEMLQKLFPDADITNQDATEFSPDINVDVVMANPPFGSIPTRTVQTIKGKKSEIDLKKLEYYIAWKALESMRDDGKAVLILGAEKENQITGNHVIFTRAMYNQYNVTGHFELDGQFYRKMGAEWPVEIFIIEGRKDYPLNRNLIAVPKSVRRIAYAEGWEGVREYLNRTDRADSGRGAGDNAAVAKADVEVPAGERGTERQEDRPVESVESVPAEPAKQTGEQPVADRERDNEPRRDTERVERVKQSLADEGKGRPGQRGDTTTPDTVKPGSDDTRIASSDGAKVDPIAIESDNIGAGDSIQEAYNPVSDSDSIGALISKALAVPTREALESLREKTGEKSLDDYVAKQLGYKSGKDIPFFSAEQVDGLAESFYNLLSGGGNIIADQTGVGKGRMAAAIIQWASRQGKIPVFFTEKVGLFNDIYRDLRAIGGDKLRPFIFNSNGEMSYEDDAGNKVVAYKHNEKVFAEVFRRMRAGDYSDFTGPNRKFDYIAITYSQIRDGEEQRGKKGKQYLKKDAFAMARNLIPILDESHNAAGAAGDVGEGGRGRAKDKRTNQMANTMDIISRDRADGVTYLSATWAKTPENMPVYHRVFNQANLTQDEIQTAFDRGDIAMQEMVVATLAASGKYIRREQGFAGVSWRKNETDPKSEQADKEKSQADRAMSATRKLIELDRHVTETFSGLNLVEIIDTFGLEVPEEYIGGEAAASGHIASSLDKPDSPFSSVHNYVNTFLAAVKADRSADRAIEMIKEGKKPIVTVQNTMESQMDAILETGAAKIGEPFPGTYAEILETKIAALMRVSIKHPTKDRDSFSFNLPIEAFPVETQQRIEQYRAELKKINLKDLPFSPIDYVMAKIKDAGYNVGEITGRGKYLDYSDTVNGMPVIKTRPGGETTNAGKRKTLMQFNNGELDALILNSAGATGLSAHSSRDFKDQRQRAMLIMQPFDDINTFTQMLGRIHRTGGIYDANKVTSTIPGKPASYGFPEYEYMQSSLGMEVRPAARLDAKAKSLNANTSSNKKGHQDISDIDVANKYGTRVVRRWLSRNTGYAYELGYENADDIKAAVASQVTGRIAILDQQIQQTFWDEVVKEYNDLIDELDSLGENDLKVQTYDKADAVTVERRVVYGSEGDVDNPPVYWEKIDMAIPGNPTSYDAATNRAKKGRYPTDSEISSADAAFDRFIKFKEKEKQEYESRTGRQSGIRIPSIKDGAETVKNLLKRFKLGSHVSGVLSVETDESSGRSREVATVGIVTNVSLMPAQEGFVGNPWLPSRIRVEIATPSFASGKLILPISKIATWVNTDTQTIYPAIEQQQRRDWQKAFDANSNKRVTKTALSGDMIKASSMSTDSRAVQLQRRDGVQELVWLSNEEGTDMRITMPVEKLTDEQIKSPPAIITSMDSGRSVMIAEWAPPAKQYSWEKTPAKKNWQPKTSGAENYDIRIRYSSPVRNIVLRDKKLAELLDPKDNDPFVKETLARNANYMVLKETVSKKDLPPILKRLSELLNESGGGLTSAADREINPVAPMASSRSGSAPIIGILAEHVVDKTISLVESAYTFVVRGGGSFIDWLKTVAANVRKFAAKAWSNARKILNLNRRGGIIRPSELIKAFKEAAAQATKEEPLPQRAAEQLVETAVEAGVELGKRRATETGRKIAKYRKSQADKKLMVAKKKLADLRQKLSWNYDEKRFLLDYAQKLVTEDKAKMLRDITLATTPKKVDSAIKRISDLIDKRMYKNAMLRFQVAIKRAVKLRPEFQRIANLAPRKVANVGLFYRTLNAMNKYIKDSESAILPPEVQAQIDILLRDRPGKISAEALNIVAEAVDALKKVSDSLNTIEFGDRVTTIAKTVESVENHIKTEDKIADEDGEVGGAKWFFKIGSLQFEDIADMLGKAGKDFVYGALRAGEILTKQLWFQGRDSVFDVMKKHGHDPDDAATRRWYEEKTSIITNDGPVEIDRRFKMNLIATLLDPDTRNQVLDSVYKKGKNAGKVKPGAGFVIDKKGTKTYRLDATMFRIMLKEMGKDEQAIVNAMRENLNTTFRRAANDVFVQLTGYAKLVKSGYWPRVRDTDPTGLNEGFKNFTPKTALEQLGIFKERIGSKSPVLIRDINDVYQNHIKKMATFIGLAVPARNIEIILGAGKLGRSLEERFGKQYVNRIKDQIQAIADLGTPGGGEMNKMLSGLLRNISVGFLGFNPRAAIKQFGGLFTAMTEISPEYISASLGAARDQAIEKEMFENSSIIRDRYDSTGSALVTPTFDAERGMLRSDSALEIAKDKAMSWLHWGDKAVSQIIWQAAKMEISAKQPNLKGDALMRAVAERAEQVISRTQNVTSVVDMSGVAIESRKSAAYKALTMFQSQGNSIYNILRRSIRRFRRGDIELPEFLWAVSMAVFGNAIWSSLVGRLVTLRGWKGKEPAEARIARWRGEVAWDVLQENMNIIYGGSMFSSFARNAERIINKQPFFESGKAENVVESVVNNAIRGSENALRGAVSSGEKFKSGPSRGKEKSEVFYKRAISDILRATAPAAGIPVVPINELNNLLDIVK